MTRVVLLNALPLNAFPYNAFSLSIARISLELLEKYKGGNIVCYIRHPATLQLLNSKLNLNLKTSSDLYSYVDGDIIFVITLKQEKVQRGQEVQVTQNDIEVFKVVVNG